jgi:hypothetical protein
MDENVHACCLAQMPENLHVCTWMHLLKNLAYMLTGIGSPGMKRGRCILKGRFPRGPRHEVSFKFKCLSNIKAILQIALGLKVRTRGPGKFF